MRGCLSYPLIPRAPHRQVAHNGFLSGLREFLEPAFLEAFDGNAIEPWCLARFAGIDAGLAPVFRQSLHGVTAMARMRFVVGDDHEGIDLQTVIQSVQHR